jgi:hypothetical protein
MIRCTNETGNGLKSPEIGLYVEKADTATFHNVTASIQLYEKFVFVCKDTKKPGSSPGSVAIS